MFVVEGENGGRGGEERGVEWKGRELRDVVLVLREGNALSRWELYKVYLSSA